MSIEQNVIVSDVPNIEHQAMLLDCQVPSEFAILPRNFLQAKTKGELFQESDTATLRILFRQAHLKETRLEREGESFHEAMEHGFVEVVVPTLFFTFAALGQDPNLTSVALNVVSNYLYDFFKGRTEDKVARVNIVVKTRSQEFRKVEYSGPVAGLDALSAIVTSTLNEDNKEAQATTKNDTDESA